MTQVQAKKPDFLTDVTEIKNWLATYCNLTDNYSISPDGHVSVTGDLTLNATAKEKLSRIAVQFSSVTGDVYFKDCNELKSLEGAPRQVEGTFDCSACRKLISLQGAPQKVGDNFFCGYCDRITNLEGAPSEIAGKFSCKGCWKLCSLQGGPRIVGGCFECFNCRNLISLEGAPTTLGGGFWCYACPKLLSLEGAPKRIPGICSCGGCTALQTLVGGPEFVGGGLVLHNCRSLKSLVGGPDRLGFGLSLTKSRITSLETLTAVPPQISFERLAKPSSQVISRLLHSRVQFVTEQEAPWISIVNDYHKSGDLLTAITQFEKYYKVPFIVAADVTAPKQPELPSL